MEKFIEYARTQVQVTPPKLQVKFHISYMKALTVLSELKRMGIVDARGFTISEDL